MGDGHDHSHTSMALAAIQLAVRGRERSHRTFGLYRLEILAALANAVLLFAVATLGQIANLVGFALLREGAKESINVEGAYLEVLSDTIGSVGVIVGVSLRGTGMAERHAP